MWNLQICMFRIVMTVCWGWCCSSRIHTGSLSRMQTKVTFLLDQLVEPVWRNPLFTFSIAIRSNPCCIPTAGICTYVRVWTWSQLLSISHWRIDQCTYVYGYVCGKTCILGFFRLSLFTCSRLYNLHFERQLTAPSHPSPELFSRIIQIISQRH